MCGNGSSRGWHPGDRSSSRTESSPQVAMCAGFGEQGQEVDSTHPGHVHLEGFVTDITERVRAEEELGQTDRHATDVARHDLGHHHLQGSQLGVLSSEPGHRGDPWRSQDELKGKTDFDLFAADIARGFWDEEQAVMDANEPVTTDHELVLADGQIRWFEVVKKPVLDGEGNVVGLLSSEHDITERKRMEQTLQDERNLLRTIVDNIPDFIFVKDTECRLIFDNIAHAVALGASHPDEVLGKTDFDFSPTGRGAGLPRRRLAGAGIGAGRELRRALRRLRRARRATC